MSKVYYKTFSGKEKVKDIQKISRKLLEKVIREENVQLEKEIPLKVHFGEAGNVTYLKQKNFDGVIDYLEDNDIKAFFIETNVLYGGKRYKEEFHRRTAMKHGFTRLPVVIADGSHGQDYYYVEINKKHFDKCKLGNEFSKYSQLIVLAHFKGHALAGFGGAIKQLSMGYASKGGKLAMHLGIKPQIKNRKCDRCRLCQERCAEDAIILGKKSYIDHSKCVGCGACVAICPHRAVSIFSIRGIGKALNFSGFREKLVEYAYAAQKGKDNIYVNFVMNVTSGCDCEGKKMKVLIPDVGILASTDPVAIDKACFDMVKKAGKKFRGIKIFAYAEKIGLGSADYELVKVN